MRDCPHCRHEFASSLDECPHCGAEWQASAGTDAVMVPNGPAHQPHVPIARFANVAEAGYFHCELDGHMPCEVRLTTQNHFDAPSASWWTNYVLTVPETDAEQATDLLKQIVADTDPSEFIEYGDEPVSPADIPIDGFPIDSPPTSASRIHWTPIILTLTAGSLVVWAAKQVHRHARNPAGGEPNQVDIWEQLGNDGRPWVQNLDDGTGRRELIIDHARKFATLREDTDGDGVFERRSRISLTPAGN